MSDSRLTVAVLFGGRSGEHAVSLRSARAVLSALNPERYEIRQIGISKTGEWFTGPETLDFLESGGQGPGNLAVLGSPAGGIRRLEGTALGDLESIDVLFPVTHGTYGEDGALQGLLEMADLAYVGAGVVGSAVCMDKAVFKAVVRDAGLPILPFVLSTRRQLDRGIEQEIERIEGELSYPMFVKPANLGSSVGVSKAVDAASLRSALLEAAKWDRRVVTEQGIDARELEVAVLGNEAPKASVVGEIVPDRDFYDYDSKYADSDSTLEIPAEISPELSQSLRDHAINAYLATDCAGLGRVDFLIDRGTGEIWLNEINTLPGFTTISMYPKLWEAKGLGYAELLDELIALALQRRGEQDRNTRVFN